MARYLSILFVIMTLSMSTMPCFLYDRCLFAGTEENCPHDDDGSCTDTDLCSPFMHCNTCSGCICPQETSLAKFFLQTDSKTVFYYKEEVLQPFLSAVFQPPRA